MFVFILLTGFCFGLVEWVVNGKMRACSFPGGPMKAISCERRQRRSVGRPGKQESRGVDSIRMTAAQTQKGLFGDFGCAKLRALQTGRARLN